MALIEGVGDEVTVLFALLLAALGWASPGPPRAPPSPPRRPAPPPRCPSRAPAPPRPPPPSTRPPARPRPRPRRAERPPMGREEAGPGEPGMVLRLKFLNDTERLARVRPGDTVGALKRAYFPGQEQQVRLIYQGQLLRDDAQSLSALHLTHNSVLHCHISQHSPAPAPAGPHASADPVHAALNVGSLMLPLFVLMLAVLWYFQLQYRHVFTATATTFLAGLTLLFSFMAFTMYRR
uniref:Transmembrane and ubiquitin-like domain-containing protein 1 n=1 Tax=Anas platyrhynchos TaxID=8839 RepID=A0A8B9QR36_ANAPL